MADPITNFAGIGSGFDYTSLVNGIIAAASQPATNMQNKIDTDNAQLTALSNFTSLLNTFDTAASSLRDGSAFSSASLNVLGGTAANGQQILSASAGAGADPGSYSVQVTQLAQAEKLSGSAVAGTTTALGYTGDFQINGKDISIVATDTLSSIRDKINTANTGNAPTGVSAAIVSDSSSAQRLVLTSSTTGSGGINLVDGAQGVVRQLGLLDDSETIKHATSAGAQSDNFTSATATIGSQLGLVNAPGAQTVTIGGQSVSIDLNSDSLTSIATKLSALSGVQATVQSTTVNGATKYYLDVRNTTSFVDAGHTLEQLGILVGGRSATTQQLQSAALTAGDGTTPATASTLLTNLWNGGSASGASAGDTLTVSGTRGDGAAVNMTITIGANTTLQDVLDQLNNTTNGFGAGTRPATASIEASGHLVLNDSKSGSSSLALNIVANNEGGGRLDLGNFTAVSTGRSRQLVQGTDAKFSVDGVAFTRSSNTVGDVIANTTLTLTAADPNATATITISHDQNAAQQSMQAFVDAYNKVIDFVKQQNTATTDGSANPALYNDPTLRTIRSGMSQSILQTVSGAASDLSSVGLVGLDLTQDGHLSLDSAKFQTIFNTRYADLQKLFSEQGTTTDASVVYTASTSATQPGNYAVQITQAASQAMVAGTGFSGTYTDDATPDVINITDLANNAAAQVQLSNGMTMQQIVDAMNTAFSTAQSQVLQTGNTLYDASNMPAAGTAPLTSLRDANGNSLGVAVGDTIDFSGVGAAGLNYTGSFTVAANSTVNDLVSQIQSSLGADATVSFSNGQLSIKSTATGTSSITLSLTPHNQGGGQLNFGAVSATTAGRGIMGLVASVVGGQIQILQNAFGSAAGIAISFLGGGTDSTAQLGLAAGSVHGTDVAGTIGGYAATGSGRSLVGNTGTPVDGLSLSYLGTTTGAMGSLSLVQGLGYVADQLVKSWTDSVNGTITARNNQLNDNIKTLTQQISDFNDRMEVKRQALLAEYLAMDTAVQKFKQQASAFSSIFSSSQNNSSSSSSSSS